MLRYLLHLPVYKRGDDLAYCMEGNPNNLPQAFADLAEQYRAASDICTRMGEIVQANPDNFVVDADTHYIGLASAEELNNSLIEDGYLELDDESGDEDDMDDDDEENEFNEFDDEMNDEENTVDD